jgi:hypothetical protein
MSGIRYAKPNEVRPHKSTPTLRRSLVYATGQAPSTGLPFRAASLPEHLLREFHSESTGTVEGCKERLDRIVEVLQHASGCLHHSQHPSLAVRGRLGAWFCCPAAALLRIVLPYCSINRLGFLHVRIVVHLSSVRLHEILEAPRGLVDWMAGLKPCRSASESTSQI